MSIKLTKPIILVTKIKKLGGSMVALAQCEDNKVASVVWSGPDRGWEFQKDISAGEIITAPEVLEKDIEDFKLKDQIFHIVELDSKFVKN